MRPPPLAQGLIAATAPTGEYEIIAGDLHEEYVRIVAMRGAKAADRWYWSQTLLSIPSLLSYSRSNISTRRRIGAALISLGVLVAMLAVATWIGAVLRSFFDIDRVPVYVWMCVDYVDAVIFGAILARLVRIDGLRVTFFASLFLVVCFVVPALAGNAHSQAPLVSWITLFGAIPTMCFGAILYQLASHRTNGAS